jgi:YD repeat-containing protein
MGASPVPPPRKGKPPVSLSNTTENATLKMHLQGSDPSYRAGASQYVALFSDNAGTEADLEAGGRTYELDYTGYGRVALTKASAWTDGGSSFSNAGIITFGKRTDGGATQTARWFAIVDTASGDFSQCIYGQLDADLPIAINNQPLFDIGGLVITAT